MSKVHQGLYPIVRRVRRPLVPPDAGTAAPAVVPAKPAEVPVPREATQPETKTESTPSHAND